MSTRPTVSSFLLGAVLLASFSTAGQSKPDTYQVPRTPWGEPDLQGTYNATDVQGVPLERA